MGLEGGMMMKVLVLVSAGCITGDVLLDIIPGFSLKPERYCTSDITCAIERKQDYWLLVLGLAAFFTLERISSSIFGKSQD